MSEPPAPYSGDELAASLEDVHREIGDYFEALAPAEFFRRPEDSAWSPAENLIHLVKSTKSVTQGMDMPRLLLRLLFRRPKGAPATSRDFAGVVEIYRDALAKGGRATGPYIPTAPASADDPDAEASRSRALAGWRGAGAELVDRVRKWDEKSLDKYRLPHPLLGNLTVREILFFTLYHDRHHLDSVQRRLGNGDR